MGEPAREHASHVACFRQVPIFQELSEGELHEVVASARPRRFGPGEDVFRAGERSKHLFVVASGLVKVARSTPEGREQVVRLLGTGEFYGERALFAADSRGELMAATGVTLVQSDVCVLESSSLQALLARNPAAGMRMLRALAGRIDELEELVEQLAVKPVEGRVAALLLKLARAGDGGAVRGAVVELRLKQEELARLVGTTQETLSRRLHALEDDGVIRIEERRRVRLVDVEALVERAGEG